MFSIQRCSQTCLISNEWISINISWNSFSVKSNESVLKCYCNKHIDSSILRLDTVIVAQRIHNNQWLTHWGRVMRMWMNTIQYNMPNRFLEENCQIASWLLRRNLDQIVIVFSNYFVWNKAFQKSPKDDGHFSLAASVTHGLRGIPYLHQYGYIIHNPTTIVPEWNGTLILYNFFLKMQ